MIEILDTTLRDGGYINSWNFSNSSIQGIINNLINSKIEYIECGFLNEKAQNSANTTLFCSIEKINQFINKPFKYALMINYGEYDIDKIPKNNNQNLFLRIAFKKDKMNNALDFCAKLQEKGYSVSLNPCRTSMYSFDELEALIEKANIISPYCITIVDTMGTMKQNKTIKMYDFINSKLNSEIKLGFHFHNNLQMAFANVQSVLSVSKSRDIIIDSSLFGMGRGSGNLASELICNYLNTDFNKNYKIEPILDAIEKYINPIFKTTPWGYSIPFYLTAINNCHPNYGKYLAEQNIPLNQINELLKQIPDDKKCDYNENKIK